MVKGILIDVDGTLVLSNDAHAESWVEAFGMHGLEINFEQVRPLIGMGGDKLIPKLAPNLNKDSGLGKEISATRTKLFLKKYADKLQPTPGARELIHKLQEMGIKTIVASSAKEEELALLLKAAGVEKILTETTTSTDVDKSKPDPDIINNALGKIGLPAELVVLLGDTPYDIEAAKGCKVDVIAVRCGGCSDDQLSGAIAIYDNPQDLLEQYENSPLFR